MRALPARATDADQTFAPKPRRAGADLRFFRDRLGRANIRNAVICAAPASDSRGRKAREYLMRVPGF